MSKGSISKKKTRRLKKAEGKRERRSLNLYGRESEVMNC
jgi:hypothetical protein